MKRYPQIALAALSSLNIQSQSSAPKPAVDSSPYRQDPNPVIITFKYDDLMGKGQCGGLRYEIREHIGGPKWFETLEIRNQSGKLLLRKQIDNTLYDFSCNEEPIKGVRTMQFNFSTGGSGIRTDWLIYRVNPFHHLLSISLSSHSDDSPVEHRDLNHDGQNELLVHNGGIGFSLCESCDYDADTVQYLLCYSGGTYHECAKEHPDYFRSLIEHGFKQLVNPREKHHRLAWSLYILFHAEEIGEGDAVWTRLEAVLPPRFFGEGENSPRPHRQGDCRTGSQLEYALSVSRDS